MPASTTTDDVPDDVSDTAAGGTERSLPRGSAYRLAALGGLLVLAVAAASVLLFYKNIDRTFSALLTEFRATRRIAVEAAIANSRQPASVVARDLSVSDGMYGYIANPAPGQVPGDLERVIEDFGFAAVCLLNTNGQIVYQNGVLEEWPADSLRPQLDHLVRRLGGTPETQIVASVADRGQFWLAGARVVRGDGQRTDQRYDGYVVVLDAIDADDLAHIESVTGVSDLQILAMEGAVTAAEDDAPATLAANMLLPAASSLAPSPPAPAAPASVRSGSVPPPPGDRLADSLDLNTYIGSSGLVVTYRNVLPLAEVQMGRWRESLIISFAAVVVCLLFFAGAGGAAFVRPFVQLSGAVSLLARTGEWSHPRLRYREFQVVADALWVALDRLHRAESELLGAQGKLERRVEERTSELALANNALADSEERYRAVVEDLPVFVCRFDTAYRILFVNQAYCRYFGCTAGAVVGTDLLDLVAEDQRTSLIAHLGHLSAERPNLTHEMRGIGPDGRTRWMRWTDRVLLDGNGGIVGYQTVGQDITEQRELENQLRQAQKMETIGRLAGGVAHDFNNIVTAIMGHASFALEGAAGLEGVDADIREVLKSAERARKLTHQLLAFSRRQMIELRLINLNDLIFDMDRMLRRLIGENIELVTLPGQPMGSVRADQSQVEQVLANLVVNARDAMPDGGTLTVETAVVDLDESYQAKDGELKPGRFVMLAVSDTGVGMDAEVQSHLFEPFFTTKEIGRGTGLGLATAYGIVKQHGGHVWVYSEVGKGSTFKVYLPLAQEPASIPGEPAAVRDGQSDTGTILVAEDDPAVRMVTTRILERHGYQVIKASTGDEALRLADQHLGRIDLLVTDVVMPQMSGRELAERLRRSRPRIPVLYVSGYSDNDIHHHGVLDDGVDFLQKPFTEAMLAEKVRRVIRPVP
ncbi:MAG: ATP-binding protein [Anaerolineae bacterium]